MSKHPQHLRRGLTMVELVIALAITTMIGAAIASMMAAVTAGVTTRRDTRSAVLRSHSANSRLGSYIRNGHCALSFDGTLLTIWLDDSRESGTVHASEVRWMLFDSVDGVLDVYFTSFPDFWRETQREMADAEYRADANWGAVLASYQAQGLIETTRILDGATTFSVQFNAIRPIDSTVLTFGLGLTAQDGVLDTRATHAFAQYQKPSN